MYLNRKKQKNFQTKTKTIESYEMYFRLLISLFHYIIHAKNILNIDHFYEICSNPKKDLIEWPIVISNTPTFDLPNYGY